MPQFYKVGEMAGPFKVIHDTYQEFPDGSTIEYMETENGNSQTIYGQVDDRSYHNVPHLPRRGGVLVPFTKVDKRVVDALHGEGIDSEWVDVSGSPYDYWRVLCDYFEPTHDLAICEHDVEWRPDVTAAFRDCPEVWCVFPYSNHTPSHAEAWRNMLGCTRFRKELIAAVPNAVIDIEQRYRDWHYTCDGVGKALREAGFTHHWHYPPVQHNPGTFEPL